VKLRILDIIFISALILVAFIYLMSLRIDGTEFSMNFRGGDVASYTSPPINSSTVTGYILSAEDDKISFDVVSIGVSEWHLEIEIIDLATGESFLFNRTYFSPRAQTPLFITPHTGYYFFNITVKILDTDFPIDFELRIKLSGSQAAKYEVINRLPYLLVLIVTLYLVIKYVEGSREGVFWRGSLGELSWEFRTTNAWMFLLAILFLYSLMIFDLRSFSYRDYKYWLLHLMSLSKVPDFFMIFYVIISMLVVLLFSHKWETGLERTEDILPRGRLRRFFIKYLTVFTTGYIPIVILSFLNYVLWVPSLIFNRPLFFFDIYIRGAIYYLFVLFLCISLCIIQAVAIPKTSISLLTSLLPGLLLYLESPLIPPELHLKPLLIRMDPKYDYIVGMEGLWWVDGWRYFTLPEDTTMNWILLNSAKIGSISFPIIIIILFLCVSFIACLIYVKRENP